MNTRSLAKMGPWEQSGHISLVPTLWRRHQRKRESCLDYIFCVLAYENFVYHLAPREINPKAAELITRGSKSSSENHLHVILRRDLESSPYVYGV